MKLYKLVLDKIEEERGSGRKLSEAIYSAQNEIFQLVKSCIRLYEFSNRGYKSLDLVTDVFLKLIDWVITGKNKRNKIDPKVAFHPDFVIKLGKNLGYKKGRPDVQTISFNEFLSDCLPDPNSLKDPFSQEEIAEPESKLLQIWLEFEKEKLHPKAKAFLGVV